MIEAFIINIIGFLVSIFLIYKKTAKSKAFVFFGATYCFSIFIVPIYYYLSKPCDVGALVINSCDFYSMLFPSIISNSLFFFPLLIILVAIVVYKNKHILAAFLTLIILIATLHIPQVVKNEIELKAVRSGFPFPFLTGDCSQYDPPFPWKFTALCGTWGEGNITGFSWMNFILSYVLIFLMVSLTIWIITILFRKIHKK